MTTDNIVLNTYIYRLLKSLHPKTGLSGSALKTLNNMSRINVERMMTNINNLMIGTKKKTISSYEVNSSVRLTLPRAIANDVLTKSTSAVEQYLQRKQERKEEKEVDENLKPESRSTVAGLVFPITRIQNLMMTLSTSTRKTDTAAVSMTAVCEYIMTDVLNNSAKIAIGEKRVRITPSHIMKAVESNVNLREFYRNSIFAGGVYNDEEETVANKSKTTTRKIHKTSPKKSTPKKSTPKKQSVKKTKPKKKGPPKKRD